MAKYLSYFELKQPFTGTHSSQKAEQKPEQWLRVQEVYSL